MLDPLPRANFHFLLRPFLYMASSPSGAVCQFVGLFADVADRPKTHRDLHMPSNDAVRLVLNSEQIHLAEAMLHTTNREKSAPIQPLLNQTFCEQGHGALRGFIVADEHFVTEHRLAL